MCLAIIRWFLSIYRGPVKTRDIHYTGNHDGLQTLQDEEELRQIKQKWDIQVEQLKKDLVLEDTETIQEMVSMSRSEDTDSDSEFYVSGVDISFIKGDLTNACACLVVLSYPQLNIVYKDLQMIKLTTPYIAGYLGFRESEFAVELMEKLKSTSPQFLPHVMMVDGNGILHYQDFGSACHIGVALDMPCIGVAKNLLHTQGIERNDQHKQQIESLKNSGDTFELVTDTGKTLGVALKTGDKSVKPVYVSQGNHISLRSSAKLVQFCSIHRVPEPIRQADILSREYLREHFPESNGPS